ncbi:FitA-like ribbon-helix-helix domain-containing protein [Sphingomonas sp. RS2018]
MATLTIRQLDDAVYARLKAKALANHRSLEAEVRMMLTEQVETGTTIVDRLRRHQTEMVERHGYLPDSVALIRQIREEE